MQRMARLAFAVLKNDTMDQVIKELLPEQDRVNLKQDEGARVKIADKLRTPTSEYSGWHH